MKVWCVFEYVWDSSESGSRPQLDSIFSTREAARAYVADKKPQHYWDIDVYEVME